MSFSRGAALAAMAASALVGLGNKVGEGIDLLNGMNAEASLLGPMLRRRSGRYGRSHWRGHRGQLEKAIARRRRRNEMRRETHRLQRTAG